MGQQLTPPELDFLWESFGGGELPYPLSVRSHGATMEERAALRQQTLRELQQRGIADSGGRPAPEVEEWFEILAGSGTSLDSVQLDDPEAAPRLVVAGAIGPRGVFAVQTPEGLQLEGVPSDGLASAVVGLLPNAPRGSEKSITMPLEQLLSDHGVDFLQRRGPSGDGSARGAMDEDRKALARIHAQPRLRGGQIGANARSDTGGRRRMPVLSWFDTETGRYFTQASRGTDGRDWITIARADAPTLRHRLSELLASASHAATAPL